VAGAIEDEMEAENDKMVEKKQTSKRCGGLYFEVFE